MKLYKYNCGLTIGRFQPFHFGHDQLIKRMLDECKMSVIAIGSAQESRTYGNPFTYSERKRMLYMYYGAKRLSRTLIIPIKDIFNLGKWAEYALGVAEKHIKNKVNIYYSGNDQDATMFLGNGRKVGINDRDIGMYAGMSASKIRGMILRGSNDWKIYVPSTSHAIVKKVYGYKADI